MARSRCYRLPMAAIAAALALVFPACREAAPPFLGLVKPEDHVWLRGKRVFIDPGHGGSGSRDYFRVGPGGITEEKANLEVALALQGMLVRSGAVVAMSRSVDTAVPMEERIAMAERFSPDLLLSIHHNATVRTGDSVQYPSVLFWGSRGVNPASHDLALLVLEQLERVTESKGGVFSDYAIFSETGTRILRMTKELCPGIIGEGGFLSDELHSRRLRDHHYIEDEAVAYFLAVSRYVQWGIPRGEVVVSCGVDTRCAQENCLSTRNPVVAIRVFSGNSNAGIDEGSLKITMDGVPVGSRKLCIDMFAVEYGRELYPGTHRFRFCFRNLRGQSSMLHHALVSVPPVQGDYKRLLETGRRLSSGAATARNGLFMLLSASSLAPADPRGDEVLWLIAGAFSRIGERAMANHYRERVYYFYPQSRYGAAIAGSIMRERGLFFPADHYGKAVPVRGDHDFCRGCGTTRP
ncbi:MAG: N-acetylmuramoyl-L-alanine amidase [Spirochaetes bacterium]|nr:N-acetylmuramoyl-L-alanine amidase [Spirochaetota bacterium]